MYSLCWSFLFTCLGYEYMCVYKDPRYGEGYDRLVLVFFLPIPNFPLFRKMMFPAPQFLRGVNSHDHSVVFAYAPWFDSSSVLDDEILMPYVLNGHLFDEIPLFALECNDFWSHKRALDFDLEVPKYSQRSARGQFVDARKVHWKALSNRI